MSIIFIKQIGISAFFSQLFHTVSVLQYYCVIVIMETKLNVVSLRKMLRKIRIIHDKYISRERNKRKIIFIYLNNEKL